jgi:hypothetical protein
MEMELETEYELDREVADRRAAWARLRRRTAALVEETRVSLDRVDHRLRWVTVRAAYNPDRCA